MDYLTDVYKFNGFSIVPDLLKNADDAIQLEPGGHALCAASRRGHLEIVKLLLADAPSGRGALRQRIDPSADDNYAIRYASSNGHLEIVKLLLADSRVDPSTDDNFAIRFAPQNGHIEIVKLLMKKIDMYVFKNKKS